MDFYGRELPPGAVSSAMSLKHTCTHTRTLTHKHKSEPRQSFADISPPATTTHEQHCSLFRGRKTRSTTPQSEWDDNTSAQTLDVANKEINGTDN